MSLREDRLRYDPAFLPDDPERRVVALDLLIAKNMQWENALRVLCDALTGELEELTIAARTRVDTTDDQRRRHDLREALTQIQRGVRPGEGVIRRVSFMVNKPGLIETGRTLAAARKDRTQSAARAVAARSAPAPYRLKPGKKYFANGRPVQPGEVVRLTANQARAFADRFEAVTEF